MARRGLLSSLDAVHDPQTGDRLGEHGRLSFQHVAIGVNRSRLPIRRDHTSHLLFGEIGATVTY